jgi:hypothetical protein
MHVAAGPGPEQRSERRHVEPGDLGDGRDPGRVELAGAHPPHAPQGAHRQRVQERELPARADEEQPVGLGHRARHLGQELGRGDADGDREIKLVAHLAPQPSRDLQRGPRDGLQAPDIEERLVDRQRLDERRGPPEDLEHRPAGGGVGGEPRRDHDRLRAHHPRPAAAHRRPHPAGPRLVAGGQHDPATDDHRTAAQRRVIALFDRCVERVEVGVEDRRGRGTGHERMFSSAADGTVGSLGV